MNVAISGVIALGMDKSSEQGLTRSLAAYVAGSQIDDIPSPVLHEASRAFVNWLGCALGGCRDESVDIVLATLEDMEGAARATVIGHGRRTDPAHAALLNCLSSSVLGFDDTHPRTIIHPTGPVAAALMAVAEVRPTTGAEFLHALVLGIELECRLGNALIPPPAASKLSFLPTGLTGAIGAASAVGKLLGLDPRAMSSAIGIAAGSAGGIRESIGSMAAPYFLAAAARNGLVAALLAAKGMTAGESTLEGPKGFLEAYGAPANERVVLEDLGKRYELSTNTYKPYPCGAWVHATVDVCLELARRHDIDPSEIESVRLRVNPRALAIAGRMDPRDRVEAQASLFHWAAAALVRRRAGLAEASDDCVRDALVTALRGRIAAQGDPDCAVEAASAEIALKGGQELRGRVSHCLGSLAQPLSDDDLSRKFLVQACAVLPEDRAQYLLRQGWAIGQLDDVGQLARDAGASG